MPNRSLFPSIVRLSELADGQEADFFALLTQKEELTTRDGKPYVRVAFRDAQREVKFPIWHDSAWSRACADWEVGVYYKLRATYRETSYGPQLELVKVRPIKESDHSEGFDPSHFQPTTQFDPQEMFGQLRTLAEEHISQQPLRDLVLAILDEHRGELLKLPAATHNHHAFLGGWLEHVLSVTRNCVFLADKYEAQYPQLQPPLDKGLVVAGGILHDIGKLRELQVDPVGATYTSAGNLIGHILQGRDLLREAVAQHPLDDETLLRLEHIIVSHQRLPEWGSPKPPMTPEALLVHYADDIDAKFQIMFEALRDDATESPVTSARNALRQKLYRGEKP